MTKNELITTIRDSLVSGNQKDAEDAIDKYARDDLRKFIEWMSEKSFAFVEYMAKINPLITSHETDSSLAIFEQASIEERYLMYLQHKEYLKLNP